MQKMVAAIALGVCALGSTAVAGVSTDYVARAGDDSTQEHVVVVRSRNAIAGFTTSVSYDKAVLLDQREDGYTFEYTTGYGLVPVWSFIGLPRFAVLSIDAATIEATTFVLDCDLEGFCDQISSAPAEGRLEVRWAATGRTTFGPGISFATPAHARGLAFDGELDLVGDLSGNLTH